LSANPIDIGQVTEFLNVDLDVAAGHDLDPLVRAMLPRVRALNSGRMGRVYFARLELSTQPRTPDEAVRKIAHVLEALPTSVKRIWARARVRDLNVGIQSGVTPWHTEYGIGPTTLALVAKLGARIVVTVYGRPGDVVGPTRALRSRKSRRRRTRS
jgi:hypothetical protein